MSETKVRNIKLLTDDKIHIKCEVPNNAGSMDTFTITSEEPASKSFYDTTNSLNKFVCEMCEFDVKQSSRIAVKAVSFSYGGEEDVLGAVITGHRKLNNSNTPLILNTPHKIEKFHKDDGGDNKTLLPEECVVVLYKLLDEAFEYAKGKRAQLNMFDEQ